MDANDKRNTVETMEKSDSVNNIYCDNDDKNNTLYNNDESKQATMDQHSDNNNETRQKQVTAPAAAASAEESLLNRRLQLEETIRVVRKNEMELLEQHQQTIQKKNRSGSIRQNAMDGFTTVGHVLQKMNIGAWIDELEQDQNVADQLEMYNMDLEEEQERKRIVHEAQDACRHAIREHLVSFFHEHYCYNHEGVPSYESWIRELHPDNINEKTNQIDERYYLIDSDHRMMWNDLIKQKIKETRIDAKMQQGGEHRNIYIIAKDNDDNNNMIEQQMTEQSDVTEVLLATLHSRLVDERHIEN